MKIAFCRMCVTICGSLRAEMLWPSQRPRRKQRGIKLETPQGAGYLTLAAVAKCLSQPTASFGQSLGSLLAEIKAVYGLRWLNLVQKSRKMDRADGGN